MTSPDVSNVTLILPGPFGPSGARHACEAASAASNAAAAAFVGNGRAVFGGGRGAGETVLGSASNAPAASRKNASAAACVPSYSLGAIALTHAKGRTGSHT